MGFLIALGTLVVYFLGAIPFFRYGVRKSILDMERRWPALMRTEEDYARASEDARMDASFYALFWPVVWWLPLWHRLAGGTVETDRLKRIRAEAELERVRRLAREHGLEFPDGVYLPALERHISRMDNQKL